MARVAVLLVEERMSFELEWPETDCMKVVSEHGK